MYRPNWFQIIAFWKVTEVAMDTERNAGMQRFSTARCRGEICTTTGIFLGKSVVFVVFPPMGEQLCLQKMERAAVMASKNARFHRKPIRVFPALTCAG